VAQVTGVVPFTAAKVMLTALSAGVEELPPQALKTAAATKPVPAKRAALRLRWKKCVMEMHL
jgi:hypothetical protein